LRFTGYCCVLNVQQHSPSLFLFLACSTKCRRNCGSNAEGTEDVDVTIDDYEIYGFTHGNDDVLPHTDTLEDTLISYLPIPVDGGGQPMSSQEVQSVSREQSANYYEGMMHEAQNMGSPAVKDHGILNTPPPPRLTSSSPSFPFRRSDAPPSFSPSCHDDGILPTPHFSTCLPLHSYLRRSGSSPRRLGPSQTASSTPLVQRLRHLGCISFPFLPFPPSPSPRCLHLLLSSLPSSCLLHFVLPSFPPCPRFSRHSTLFLFTFVTSPSYCAMSYPR